jgi:predicted DNA-binding protein
MMPADLIEGAARCQWLHGRADRLPDPSSPYTLAMVATDHTIRLPGSTYARLQAEAARSHRAIDEIARELLDERLPQPIADREQALSALERLAALRARVGRGVDAVALVRESREELDRRIPSSE